MWERELLPDEGVAPRHRSEKEEKGTSADSQYLTRSTRYCLIGEYKLYSSREPIWS